MDGSRSTQVRSLNFCTSINDDLFVLNYVGVLLVLIFIFEGLYFCSFYGLMKTLTTFLLIKVRENY